MKNDDNEQRLAGTAAMASDALQSVMREDGFGSSQFMNAQETVGLLALVLQIAVAGYVLRLNSHAGAKRAVWALCVAYLLMALMHLIDARGPLVTIAVSGFLQQLVYLAISLLLLLGLSQLMTLLRERQEVPKRAAQANDLLEARVDEQTSELLRSNMILAREVEERKQGEAESRASRELYWGLVNSLDAIIFECRSSDLGFTFVSAQSERLLGYTAEDWLRRMTWLDIVHPDDYDRFTEGFRRTVGLDEKPNGWLEFRARTNDKQVRWFSQIAGVVPGENGDDRIRGVLLDVTERKRFEDELHEGRTLEAVGRLAGGVAHDFNNCLTVIQGYSQILLSAKSLASDSVDLVKQISQASDQAARLTNQLLAFSRKQKIKTEPVDINSVITNLASMLRAIVGDPVSVQLALSEQLPLVEADSGQLGEALVILVVNARDALPSGGRLMIQTTAVKVGDGSTERDPEGRDGTFVCIAISDSGTGIAPAVRPHIFEPFFTTKAVGKGTGLGLSTVYGIVKQHQGWVRVSSEVNQGTTFRLFLPPAHDRRLVEPSPVSQTSVQCNHETILAVDDEPAVLDLVRSILQSGGYQVLPANSGLAALKLWNDHGKNVDLLLTDLVMPDGLSGLDLLGHLRRDRPELRAILMSGYASPGLSLPERTAFIQKPYRPATLLKAVRDCLTGAGETPAEMALAR